MTDDVNCLVIIIAKDDNNITAVQFEIKLFKFYHQSTQLTDFIYTDIYCKLSRGIRQTHARLNIILFSPKFHGLINEVKKRGTLQHAFWRIVI